MEKKGECRVCGNVTELSFEHTPPASAFNNSPVYFQNHENLFNKESYLYGKKMRSNRGAGGLNLCKDCNNKTGSYYGESFKRFAHLGSYAMTERVWSSDHIIGEYAIRPLNILKQILVMFMSIDQSGRLLHYPGLNSYVLDKKSKNFPNGLRVCLYHTINFKTRNGWCATNYNGQFIEMGEITFPPFGYLYSIDNKISNELLVEITNWQEYDYDQIKHFLIQLAFIDKGHLPI